jgi:hypothetical protein
MSYKVPLKFHVARVVLAVLILLCLSVIGSGIYEYIETQDSLKHWQVKLEQEKQGEKVISGFDSPTRRVRDLKERLEKIPQTFIAPAVCIVLFSVLLYLSSKKVREEIWDKSKNQSLGAPIPH